MSEIYFRTAPQPTTQTFVPQSFTPSEMSLAAKAIAVFALAFFSIAFIYVAMMRKSPPPSPDGDKKDPHTPKSDDSSGGPAQVNQLNLSQSGTNPTPQSVAALAVAYQGVGFLQDSEVQANHQNNRKAETLNALLEKSGCVPNESQIEHERLIGIFTGDNPVSEQDMADANQFLERMNRRPQLSEELEFPADRRGMEFVQTGAQTNNPYTVPDMSEQDQEYEETLRQDQQREVEKQREGDMKEAFDSLLERLKVATKVLDERAEKLQSADLLCKQYTDNSICFRTQEEFARFENKMSEEARQALEEEAPTDQFKEELEAFNKEFSEEKFKTNGTELEAAHKAYCTSMGTVVNSLQWKKVREGILAKLENTEKS